MVYLVMAAEEFGIKASTVRACYESQEDAERQADHEIARNAKKPLRIEDENGVTLKSYEG